MRRHDVNIFKGIDSRVIVIIIIIIMIMIIIIIIILIIGRKKEGERKEGRKKKKLNQVESCSCYNIVFCCDVLYCTCIVSYCIVPCDVVLR